MRSHPVMWASCLAAALAFGCSGNDDAKPADQTSGSDARVPASPQDPSNANTGDPANDDGDDGTIDGSGGTTGIGGTDIGSGASTNVPLPALGGASAVGGSTAMGGYTATGGASTGGFSMGTGGASTGGLSMGTGGAMATGAASPGASPTDSTGGTSGDTYEAPETNPFVVVAHDPLSTFAADTDTASYDIFRRDIADGRLPDPASVRLEEYVNFFEYDYAPPAADSEVPFSVHLAASGHIVGRDTTLLRVGIQGKAAPPAEMKPPANLVFLVDVSGSMGSSDKLPLVQYLISESLALLDPDDTVSIVTYASQERVALEPTPAGDTETILAVVDSLTASGSTAGAAAMELAYEQATAGFIEGGMNHIVMCTDGDFNVGVSSTDALVEMIEERRQTGITLAVVGFGSGNLNDAMMEAISNKGDGVYGHVSSTAIADEYVEDRLLSNMYFIAKDMKIQVEFNPDHVYAYRLLGYENRAVADGDFRNDGIDGGEVGAGHQVTALYELVLPGAEIPLPEGAPAATEGATYTGTVEVAPDEMALVKVRYKERTATPDDPALEVSAALAPEDVAAVAGDLDGSFQWALAVASYAEILKDSPYADPGQLDLIGQLISRPVHEAYDDRVEFVGLFEDSLAYFEIPAPDTAGAGGAGGAESTSNAGAASGGD